MNLSDIFRGSFSPSKWRALGQHLQSSGVVTGPGLRFRQVGNKTIITANRPRATGQGISSRFKVTYAPGTQRLYVSEGSVYAARVNEDEQSIKPHVPTLDSVSLTDKPFWNVSDKDPDVPYNIWCVIKNYYTAEMRLLEDSETLELDSEQNAVLVATVTFSTGDAGLIADPLEQVWFSDIPWYFDASADNSSDSNSGDDGSDGSDDSGDLSGGGSDGSGGDEDSDSDDSSDSSDESSSSGCGCTFPAITTFFAELVEVDGSVDTSCLMEDDTNSAVLRPVKVKLTATLDSGVCSDCKGDVEILFEVGGRGLRQNVGSGSLGEGDYIQEISFNAFPCTEYTASVKLSAKGSGSAADQCCLTGSTEEVTTSLTMPGLCSNFGVCD